MLEVLEFIFGSFWRWLGVLILIYVAAAGLTPIITIKHVDKDDD